MDYSCKVCGEEVTSKTAYIYHIMVAHQRTRNEAIEIVNKTQVNQDE